MAEPGDGERAQRLEEQIAFMERELEHQKAQIADLWNALKKARKQLTRIERRLEQPEYDDEA